MTEPGAKLYGKCGACGRLTSPGYSIKTVTAEAAQAGWQIIRTGFGGVRKLYCPLCHVTGGTTQ